MNQPQKQPEPTIKTDPTQHILYQHILALLAIQNAATEFMDGIDISDCSPMEKAIGDAINNPVIKSGKEAELLQLIAGLLLFVLPGEDIITEGIGISGMQDEAGNRAVAIVLQIQPGKNAVKIMPRASAETFEAGFKKMLDEYFGRLIRIG